MKFFLMFFVLLLATCSNEMSIKTKYYDLPKQFESQFDKTLKSNEAQLSAESIDVIKQFVNEYLLIDENPVSSGIYSNYFWYVYNSLPDFVEKKERHNGYYSNQSELTFDQKLISYAIYRIDRSPENIQQIFDQYKSILPSFLSKEKYENLGIQDYVNSLIYSYNEIIQVTDYQLLLKDAFVHVDTATGVMYNYANEETFTKFSGAYGKTAYDIGEIVSMHLGYNRYDAYYGSPFLSFWMRRNNEGNMETVYKILKEIYQMYN